MKRPQLYAIPDLAKIFNMNVCGLRSRISRIKLQPYCYVGRYPVYELEEVKEAFKADDQQQYIKKRDGFIRQAEKHADRIAGEKPEGKAQGNEWAVVWNRAYFGEMDRLAKEAGLV